MKVFKTYHPLVNVIYFTAVIAFSMCLMHPAYIVVSFACSFMGSVLLNGRHAVRFNLLFLLPMMVVAALLNPLFNHEGVTILAYFPNGNPLTLESILFGLGAATVLAAVVCWFSCYNHIMTSDKFVYLFGRIWPSLSLLLSMSLRFVPRFKAQLKQVMAAQKGIGRNVLQGSMLIRTRHTLAILSIMVTWAFENAIETADSMKSRGYGLPGRSAFSVFKLSKRDVSALVFMMALIVSLFLGAVFGGMEVHYFPSIRLGNCTAYSVCAFLAYCLLCTMPVILEALEVIKWR